MKYIAILLMLLINNTMASQNDDLLSIKAEEVETKNTYYEKQEKLEQKKKIIEQKRMAAIEKEKAIKFEIEQKRMAAIEKEKAIKFEMEQAAYYRKIEQEKKQQEFDDEIRALKLAELKAVSKAKVANASRRDEIALQSAEADVDTKVQSNSVIGSNAYSNRLEAEGDKKLKEDVGTAIKSANKK